MVSVGHSLRFLTRALGKKVTTRSNLRRRPYSCVAPAKEQNELALSPSSPDVIRHRCTRGVGALRQRGDFHAPCQRNFLRKAGVLLPIYSRAMRLVCRVRHSTGSRNHSDCVNSATAFANCVAEHAMPVRRSGFPTELIPITAVIPPI